ncbi:hypothetical protein LCGC14_2235390 [marine sediment metagenome]|uniref:Uncharacterized protein n=1 Tax=marine sediment metagenome TaxID=412755 RepID=A0A0F9G214_9ZZZZ
MFNWLKRKKKRKNFFIPNPAYYPLDTYQNFIDFVKDHSHLADIELTNRVLSITNKRIKMANVLDLVQITRANLP